MERVVRETERRRQRRTEHNREHGISTQTVEKAVRDNPEATRAVERPAEYGIHPEELTPRQLAAQSDKLRREMQEAARLLEFERAAVLRDLIVELEARRGQGRSAGDQSGWGCCHRLPACSAALPGCGLLQV